MNKAVFKEGSKNIHDINMKMVDLNEFANTFNTPFSL